MLLRTSWVIKLVKLKGSKDIGDQINKSVIAPLAAANNQLSQADFPDFLPPSLLPVSPEPPASFSLAVTLSLV